MKDLVQVTFHLLIFYANSSPMRFFHLARLWCRLAVDEAEIITLGNSGWRATVPTLWESPVEWTRMYPKHCDLIWKIDAGKGSRQTRNRGPQIAIFGDLGSPHPGLRGGSSGQSTLASKIDLSNDQ